MGTDLVHMCAAHHLGLVPCIYGTLDLLDVLGDKEEVLDLDAYQGSPSPLASCWAPGSTGLETSGRFACRSHGPGILVLGV